MNIFKKVISFVQKLLKKEEPIMIEEPKQTPNINGRKTFIEALKVSMNTKKKTNKIETLICEGDGLGIQKKFKY